MTVNLKIKVSNLKQEGACHYCSRSSLLPSGRGLSHPYDKVITVEGNHIKSNFCEECFEKIRDFQI